MQVWLRGALFLVLTFPLMTGIVPDGWSASKKEDDAFWNSVSGCENVAELELYLDLFPSGHHVEEARACLREASRLLNEERLKQAENALRLTLTERQQIQRGLNSLGFDAGPIDGLLEGRSRQAIRLWQQAKGYESTGYLNRSEADALIEAAKVSTMVAGHTFSDCGSCPKMIVVPGGSFMMGSPADEKNRHDAEGPQHRVSIRKFAVSVNELTRAEFGYFVSEADYFTGTNCWTFEHGEWDSRLDRSWLNPGLDETDSHPAVCVNWDDAKAYTEWLSRKTGHQYRLLSEAEWEYVARAGSQHSRYWGDSEASQCRYANGADLATKESYSGLTVAQCHDGAVHTMAVGSYEPNGFGLHDMLGNVYEWVEDCWP